MNIGINYTTVKQILELCRKCKDYQIEFERYDLEGLPISNIGRESV